MSLYHPPRKFPFFCLILSLLFFSRPNLIAQQEAVTEFQKQARDYRARGWNLQNEGNIDEALSFYQKAILLDPNYAMAYNDLGIVFETKGWPQRAKDMYLKAIEIAPKYPDSYSNLALLYESQEDYTNAILYWIKRVLIGKPGDPWTQVARKRIQDIAFICPEAYSKLEAEYKDNLQQLDKQVNKSQASSLDKVAKTQNKGYLQRLDKQLNKPQQASLDELAKTKDKENLRQLDKQVHKSQPSSCDEFAKTQEPGQEPAKVDLSKTRALNYLARAKDSFSRGEYVSALKDATLAEYLDSSNEEISSFVEKVRKALLQ